MTELKPCPFCGGEAKLDIGEDWDVDMYNEPYPTACYSVVCKGCGTMNGYFETESEATELWNRRVNNEYKTIL